MMHQKKPPKREKPSALPINIILSAPQSEACSTDCDFEIVDANVPAMLSDLVSLPVMRVVSIDPATDNYGFRIEDRYVDPTDPSRCSMIKSLVLKKQLFRRLADDDRNLYLYADITAFLDKYREYFNEAHLVIVERQILPNYMAIRVMQHTISYFNILFPKLVVVDQDPKVKHRDLGAPKDITGNALKKWDVVKARELLDIRNDTRGKSMLRGVSGKLDDVCDTIIQVEAFCKRVGFPTTSCHASDFVFDPE